ncbi:MAG: hypothetical protein AAFN41_08570 [Planctomycetota bacterium]
MSAVSGVGGSSISQMLQQMQQKMQGAGGPSAMFKQMPAEMQAQIQSKAEAAGFDTSKISAIQQDVQSTLQNIEPGTDPRDALGAVFEKHGVDPSQMKEKMQGMMSQMAGSFQGMQGGYSLNASSGQTDLLDSLFESLDDGEDDASSGSDIRSLLETMNRLPAGSIFDRTA